MGGYGPGNVPVASELDGRSAREALDRFCTPFVLSLSKDEPSNRGSWFDRLTMSVYGDMALAALGPAVLDRAEPPVVTPEAGDTV